MKLSEFQNYLYSKTYAGDENTVCENQENPEAHGEPEFPTYDDYIRSVYKPTEKDNRLIAP